MDYELARFNMVEQQIRPWDVLDQEVLDLLMATRREEFVSPEYRALAFSDLEVPIAIAGKPTGETMLAPKVEGRILQALALKRHESALLIGAGSGYLAALMSYRARKITAIEIHPDIEKLAISHLKRAGISSVQVHQGNGLDWLKSPVVSQGDDDEASSPSQERFDAVVFAGGLSELPEGLNTALNPGARVFAFLGEFPIVQAILFTASKTGRVTELFEDILFETAVKPLRETPKVSRFKF